MRKLLVLGLSVLTILILSCVSQPKKNYLGQEEIPLKDFFKNPEVSQFQISPNGEYYAYLKPYKSRMNIHVKKTDGTGKEIRITSQRDRDIAVFFWKESDTLLFMRDFGGDENYHIFSVSVDGKNEKDLTPFEGVKAHVISDLDKVSDTEILVGLNRRDKRLFDAYRLDVKSGKLEMIAENPGTYTGWLADHAGKLRVALATDGVNTSIYYRQTEKDQFKEVLTTNFRQSVNPAFFTFDNKRLYVLSNLGRDKSVVAIFDPRTRKETKVIYAHPKVDVSGLTYSQKRKVLVAAVYTEAKRELKFFDAVTEDIYNDIKAKVPGKEISLSSLTRDEDKIIVRTYSDRSLGAYYLYDVASKQLTLLAEVSPWLNEERLAEMKPIQYTTRDNLTIHGYLTLPLGSDGKNLPMVVLPHGGPWARDVWGYRPDVQFLANRGFAVLQMNFRGSTGYGKKFWASSFKKWGKEMQDDITDGVKHFIKEGVASEDKICIYGGSYGGYAVLAGLAFTPDLYACGVDYVGVSNLFTFMETIPPYWEPLKPMLYEMVGDPVKDKELLRSASPVFHVDKIKAPLFIVQGAKDPRVNKAESDQMVEALRKRGVEVPYLVKEEEGHGFRNEENRFEFYAKMEEFLEKHLIK